MKNIALLALTLILGIHLSAQDDLPEKKWKLSAVGLSAGHFSQWHSSFDFDDVKAFVPGGKVNNYSMEDYVLSIADPNIGEIVSAFIRYENKTSNTRGRLLEFSADFYTYGELYTEYRHKFNQRDYIGWCLMQSRIDLEAKYLWDFHKSWLGFRIGPSVGIGASFDDQILILSEADTKVVEAKSNQYVHSHLNTDLYFTIAKRVELGLSGRFGLGTQLMRPNLTKSFGLRLKAAYKFK